MRPWRLARLAVESYVADRQVLAPPSGVLTSQGGAFVCIKHRHGELRGCIGTMQGTCPSLAHEIIHNAIGAATRDNRFLPITVEELGVLRYTVDIVLPMERIASSRSLDPDRYGVMVRGGGRTGVLLPRIPEIVDAPTQFRLVCRKAGISPEQPIEMYRFEVERYEEEGDSCPSA